MQYIILLGLRPITINSPRPGHNCQHFEDLWRPRQYGFISHFKLLFSVTSLGEIYSQGSNKPAVVLIMAWLRAGDKPSSEQTMFMYALIMFVIYACISVCLRLSLSSQLDLCNIWGCVVWAYPFSSRWIWGCYLIIVMKSETWHIGHGLTAGHEALVCAVYLCCSP